MCNRKKTSLQDQALMHHTQQPKTQNIFIYRYMYVYCLCSDGLEHHYENQLGPVPLLWFWLWLVWSGLKKFQLWWSWRVIQIGVRWSCILARQDVVSLRLQEEEEDVEGSHVHQSSIRLSSTCLLAGKYTLKAKSLLGNDPCNR